MDNFAVGVFVVVALLSASFAEDVRLLDLPPEEAQQHIEAKDQTLKYAPKIESNVPAVRVLGKDPQNVLEDIYLANQYHGQDGLGGYLYGYSVPDIAKTEKKQAGGDLKGAYQYTNEDGKEIKVEYWDDGTGFHQVDNLAEVGPQQVDDAPDVKAAKDEFFRRWHEEAERNSKVPDPQSGQPSTQGAYHAGQQYSAGGQSYGQTQGPLGQSSATKGQSSNQFGQSKPNQEGLHQLSYQSNLANQFQPGQGGQYQQGGGQSQYPQSDSSRQVGQYQPGSFGQAQGAHGEAGSGGNAGASQGYPSGFGASSAHHGNTPQSHSGGFSGQGLHSSSQAQSYPSGNSQGTGPSASHDSASQTQTGYGGFSGQLGAQGSQAQRGYPTGQSHGSGSPGFGGQPAPSSHFGGATHSQSSVSGSSSGQPDASQAIGGTSQSQPNLGTLNTQGSQQGYPSSQYQGLVGSGAHGAISQHGGSYGQVGGQGSTSSQSTQNAGHGEHQYGVAGSYHGGTGQGPQGSQQGYVGSASQSGNEWKYEPTEEEQGPPKGFFYNVDYPVGIIVQKQGGATGQHKRESLQGIYQQNKQEFDKLLQSGSGDVKSYQVHA